MGTYATPQYRANSGHLALPQALVYGNLARRFLSDRVASSATSGVVSLDNASNGPMASRSPLAAKTCANPVFSSLVAVDSCKTG